MRFSDPDQAATEDSSLMLGMSFQLRAEDASRLPSSSRRRRRDPRQQFTLASIDDMIAGGERRDWADMTIPFRPVALSASGSRSGETADMARRTRRGHRSRGRPRTRRAAAAAAG